MRHLTRTWCLVGLLSWGAVGSRPARAGTDLSLLVKEPGKFPLTVVTRDLPPWLAGATAEVAVGPGDDDAFVALADDGSGQDVTPGDGIAVAVFDVDPASADLTIALRAADGTVQWRDTVPPAAGVSAVVLELWGQEDRLRVAVHIAGSGEHVAPVVGGAPVTGDPVDGPPGLPSMPPTTHLASMALAGLLGGLTAGWLLARARPPTRWTQTAAPTIRPATPPRSLGLDPADPPDAAAWRLARSWAGARPVLVLAPAPTEPAPPMPPSVQRFEAPRPPARLVRAVADQLALLGKPVILVAGLEALELVEPGEAPDAAWRELQGVVGTRAELVLLLPPGAPGHLAATPLAAGADAPEAP